MKRRLVALLLMGLPWAFAVDKVQAQGYDQSVLDLLNGAKAKQGTPAEEAALQNQLQSRVDPAADASSDQKVLVSAQDKADNPYYALITQSKQDIKSCTLSRSFQLFTGQHLHEIQGDFWLKGISFKDDLRRCTLSRSYQPYQVTVPLPAKVTWTVKKWQWHKRTWRNRYGHNWYEITGYDDARRMCHHQKHAHDYVNTIPQWMRLGTSCENKMSQGITCPGGTLSRSTISVSSWQNKQTTWTCTQPQNRRETRLREVITNQCASMPSSCTLLENPSDGGGCRVISGVRVCPPWWSRNRLYSCHQNFECSTFPTSNEQCGAWFAPNMSACRSTLVRGVEAMALRKFRNIQGHLRCSSFSLSNLGGGSVPPSSPYVNGCGVFNPNRTDRYRHQGSSVSQHTAHCQLAKQPLPPGVLAKRESLQAAPGRLRVRMLTFDYQRESVSDGCSHMVSAFKTQGVTCDFLDEQVDGKMTYKSGVPLGTTLPPVCRSFQGSLQKYSICRPFWQKKRTYRF